MSLMKKQLREVWDALRASRRHRDDALSEVRIRRLRGIEDLRVPFQYPVSVLAGPNGCGKSTVLFACACAYRVPGRGPREFTPTSLFPNFTNRQPGDLSDPVRRTELEFHYVYGGDRLSRPTRDLLFADLDGTASYSEFHMSSGERSVLRISNDISELSNALVLIDEVDTGLHPYTQQQTMLELQRSALRQGLQVVVASHSPVVIDSVPPEGRIFLDRDDDGGEVRLAPIYRDIFQKALYGQSRDRLSSGCGISCGRTPRDMRPDSDWEWRTWRAQYRSWIDLRREP